jgi:hypothetical protein
MEGSAQVMKIELGRYVFGYYRVMEILAWSYIVRAVVVFRDWQALVGMVLVLFGFELFRMLMEMRDSTASKVKEETRLANVSYKLGCALEYLKIFENAGKCGHDILTDTCYYCRMAQAVRMITAAKQETIT